MKPTLEEIEDNYKRVLLRLHSGELAGIVKDANPPLQVLRKTHWVDQAITTSDLDKSYNRKNTITDFNIDAIAFLSNKSEVSDAIEFGCDENINWDWDINNPHNLKFKKGDVVVIRHAESEKIYEKMIGKVGTIVDAEYKQYVDDELITYRVRIDDVPNEWQQQGLWVFHDESSLELYEEDLSITQLRQMSGYIDDCIAQAVLNKETTINTFNIKGDNKTMNNILDIYVDRKRGKINKHYEQLIELTKLADERYAIFKDCSDKLDKLYKEDGVVTHYLVEPQLAETTKKRLEKLAELREEECCKLANLMREVYAQLSMCETYEQKQAILKTYKIIKENGKVNA